MKYISLTAVISFLLACNSLSFAQESLPSGKPVKTGNEWKMPGDALTRSKKFTDVLKTNLDLNDATAQKVFKAYLANTKSVDEIPVLPVSDEEKANKLKANKIAFDETLKGILSTEQFDKYLKMEANKKVHK